MFRIKTLIASLMLFALPFGAMAQTDTPVFAPEETQAPADTPSDIENSTPIDVPTPSEDAPAETVTWLTQIAFASVLVESLVAIASLK